MLRRISASASPGSTSACRSAWDTSSGNGFSGPTSAVGRVSVSRRSALIDTWGRGLLHRARGDGALQLTLEDAVDDQDRDDGDHDGGEQPAEVDVVAGLRGERG